MIKSLIFAVALTIVGDSIAEILHMPAPGAMIGMIGLMTLFAARGGGDAGAASLFDTAAPHFPLVFIPAAVGVVVNVDLLAHAWLHVITAIVSGTAVTIAITGLLGQYLLNLVGKARTI